MFVIGVAGQAQMGKDTLADHLANNLNGKVLDGPKTVEHTDLWSRVAFADNVKKVYQDTFDRDRPFVEEWKVKPEPPPGFDMTVRKSLQFIGDGFRKIYPTIWVDLVFRRVTDPVIISDVRYINEFLRVKKEGGLNILVGRTEKLNDDPNGSEAMIRPFVKWCLDQAPDKDFVVFNGEKTKDAPLLMSKFDVFIRNDGTIEDLYEVIDKQLVPFVERFAFTFEQEG
jgi:hypothetical protein